MANENASDLYVSISVYANNDDIILGVRTNGQDCKLWAYQLDNGAWVTFSHTESWLQSTTLPNLSVGTHTIRAYAVRKSDSAKKVSDFLTFDTTPPTIDLTISGINAFGFTISGLSDVACQSDSWQYQLDGGAWQRFENATSIVYNSITLSNLTPNTTYTVAVRAASDSCGVFGTPSTVIVTTLGASELNGASDFAVDVASPTIPINVTVSGTLAHKLHFYASDGTTLITSVEVGYYGKCDAKDMTVTLSAANRTTLLNYFPNAKTLAVKVALETFTSTTYAVSIGASEQIGITLLTSADVSAPTFTAFTYKDTETAVVNVTGNNQILLQNFSHLLVTASAGTAKNSATISGYAVTIGGVSITGTSTTLDVGAVTSSGSLELSVTCSDSRGYGTTVKKTITVLPYNRPQFSSYTLRRRNEIDSIVQLHFTGSVSSIKPGSTEKNSVVSITLKYKLTSDSEYTTLDLTNYAGMDIDGLSFTFDNDVLMSLDVDYSYDFVFYVKDILGDLSVYVLSDILKPGTPIVTLRKRSGSYPFPRVGVNNPNPTEVLDVGGNVKMNGFHVMGFRDDLTGSGTDLDALDTFGIYSQSLSSEAVASLNYPTTLAGILEVFTNPSAYVLQRYTVYNCTAIYIRCRYNDTWSDWRSVPVS